MNKEKEREQTKKVIMDYGGVIQQALPAYRVTVIVRDPKKPLGYDSYQIATNDDIKQVLLCVELSAPEGK